LKISTKIRSSLAAASIAAVITACTPAVSFQAPPEGLSEGEKKPLQIGKLIKRRQIAPVMSVAHADWLTRPERDAEEQPDRVVAALKIPRGATVADLGAGVGYFTWRLAKAVTPAGKVIAVDIQEGMLDLLAANLKRRGIDNVEMVLAHPEDPKLPVGQVDLLMLVDVYHELAHPELTMAHVRRSLKPDGRVVIIEYRKEDPTVRIQPLHKMPVEEVRAEVEPVGFRLDEVMDFLPKQHIIIFKSRPHG
jgi:predicted methyltransferase